MTSKASELVGQARQWATHYGAFANGAEGAVLSVPLRIRGAWERNDAGAFGDVFADNGSMLVGDEQLTSREAIKAYMTKAFSGDWRGTSIEDEPVDIFFLSSDAALVTSIGGILAKGETSLPAERQSRVTWMVVNRHGEWKLLSYQTSPIKG